MTLHEIRIDILDMTSILEEAHSAGLPPSMTYKHRYYRDKLRLQLRTLLYS